MFMRREVGAYDAKTRLPELLRAVEQGERITITRRGRAVAELVPPRRVSSSAAKAVEAMRELELIEGVDADTIKEWISEGRQ